jgi:hypothetical protein
MTPHTLTSREKILLIYGLYDQITRPAQYEALIAVRHLSNVIKYKAGHLNTLRVPRFAVDVAHFFDRIGTAPATAAKGDHS